MALSIFESVYTRITLVFSLVLFLNISSFAKLSPIAELHQTGLYGRIHKWNKKVHSSHNVNIEVPKNAPIIISDFHSNVGANGLRRGGKHHGVDIFAKIGTPIIAAADGRVIRAKVDKCWGPTILISHGLDKKGKPFYALYGHVRNIGVTVGQRIKRGQQIAEMGEDIFTKCGAGLHHLHFQISYNPRRIPLLGWGWANFVSDGAYAPNPHKYWENGEGKITCFEKGKKYTPSGLTYPVPCNNTIIQRHPNKTILAKIKANQRMLKRVVRLSPSGNTLANEFLYQEFLANNKAKQARQAQVSIDRKKRNYDNLKSTLLSSLERTLAEEALK